MQVLLELNNSLRMNVAENKILMGCWEKTQFTNTYCGITEIKHSLSLCYWEQNTLHEAKLRQCWEKITELSEVLPGIK
jgi:hypothetical protein